MLRIISLNLNGIRSAWNKGAESWIRSVAPDVIAFQELKAQAGDLSEAMLRPEGYHAYYHYAEKKGYSGVGLWCREKPLKVQEGIAVPEFDAEGRYLRADFADYSVISLYVPSGSSSPERQEAKFRFLEVFRRQLQALSDEGRPMMICG
ncbi:MAG: exodeoxyribonuclease III, partial [Azovibrio sp.]|nr:exodeoxyribonuclease III [Azovibrio sp.]